MLFFRVLIFGGKHLVNFRPKTKKDFTTMSEMITKKIGQFQKKNDNPIIEISKIFEIFHLRI